VIRNSVTLGAPVNVGAGGCSLMTTGGGGQTGARSCANEPTTAAEVRFRGEGSPFFRGSSTAHGSATVDRRADRSRAAGRRDTGAMTTATRIERSGPAVRAALAQLSPGECAQFEAEFAQATARAGAEYDLAPAEAVLDRWWGIAVIRANPLSEQEQAQLARARDGVFDGLWERDDHGDWHQL